MLFCIFHNHYLHLHSRFTSFISSFSLLRILILLGIEKVRQDDTKKVTDYDAHKIFPILNLLLHILQSVCPKEQYNYYTWFHLFITCQEAMD